MAFATLAVEPDAEPAKTMSTLVSPRGTGSAAIERGFVAAEIASAEREAQETDPSVPVSTAISAAAPERREEILS